MKINKIEELPDLFALVATHVLAKIMWKQNAESDEVNELFGKSDSDDIPLPGSGS